MLTLGWRPQTNVAADSPLQLNAENQGILPFVNGVNNGLDGAVIDDLLEKVASQGEVLIIVGLTLPRPFEAEGALASPASVAQQRDAIEQTQDGLLGELATYRAEAYRIYETVPAMALRVDAKAFDRVRQSAFVNHIQEDEAVPHTLASSTAVIGAPAVWAQGYDGTGQAVVILDTGIDGDHPFFGSRIVAEACFSNANGTGGEVTLCPGGGNTQTGSGAAEAEIPACLDGATQLCDHGSHVAGIAAGEGVSFDGVARNANIIAIQVFTRFNDESFCGIGNAPCVLSFNSDTLAALDYVFSTLHGSHTIASVNMSLGGGSHTSPCDGDARKPAIDNLRSVGIATVIATGNNGFTNAIGSPACISTAIAVGSTTDADNVSSFSNVHAMMDLFAPGSAIDSAVPGGGFANFNGTSMATPHVAGAWAVLKQVYPTATVDEVLQALVDTGVMVTDTRTGGTVTKPRIQLDLAVDGIIPSDSGYLTGMVDDGVNPLGGVTVTAENITTTISTLTNESGVYTMTIPAGDYDVTASLFGYTPVTVNNITIASDTVTTQDFTLTAATSSYTVDGIVTDSATGWPLYASLDIDGYPSGSIWTDPVTGYYSVTLFSGTSYDFTVNAWVAGYDSETRTVGPLVGNSTENFALNADASCSAPGYTISYTPLFLDDFESGYGNWTMGGLWNGQAETDTCGSLVAPFPSPTNAAYYGQAGSCNYDTGAANTGSLTMNTAVTLPANAFLSFWSYENTEDFGGVDVRHIEISTNNGVSWTALGLGNTEDVWHERTLDLSAYQGDDAQIRFRFDTDDDLFNNFFGWMVDDVQIATAACIPPTGGLVVGNVYDDNTNAPLIGALVSSDDDSMATVAVPADSNVDDGFYTIFAPEGSTVITASMAGGYADETANLNIVDGTTTAQDFYLDAGWIDVAPEEMEATVTAESTADQTLTIWNMGGSNLNWDITEDAGFALRGQVISAIDHTGTADASAAAELAGTTAETSAVAPTAGNATYVGQQGLPFIIEGSIPCNTDVPWLSANPITGTTSAGGSTDVTVTYDATGYAAGVYTGTICINSNDPINPQITVPVTMTVSAAGVDVGPDAALLGAPAETVTYSVAITNTGANTDTFNLTLAGSTWITQLPETEITLGAGETGSFDVTVEVPAGAWAGDWDAVTVTATSQADNAISDWAELTTTSSDPATYGIFLPAVMKN